jgi:hypothetical protein
LERDNETIYDKLLKRKYLVDKSILQREVSNLERTDRGEGVV